MRTCHLRLSIWLLAFCATLAATAGVGRAAGVAFSARTANSGNWSDAATWENQRPPQAGDIVQVRPGHTVVYDVTPEQCTFALRMIHVGGTLTFRRDISTRLDVGLVKIQPGDVCGEDGFVCHVEPDLAAVEKKDSSKPMPELPLPADVRPAALLIGEPDRPIEPQATATIRLVYFEGADKESTPAIVCCGGRWEVHGTPMNRTWLKLASPMKPGDTVATLDEPVGGWRAGDRVIVTTSRQQEYEGKVPYSGTEERIIAKIDGAQITLTEPVKYEHVSSIAGRCEVANLSRNVVIESADPAGVRGHTMYHRRSSGSISYAEFRHLGKKGVLGKYPIHLHLLRDGMRSGGGVIGASIWDSQNRFMAIHGTDFLLVRDCVGYKSVGHGFFLEDGTEQYNVLDRNLAVQALQGKRLPNQVLTFDANDGAGFWWANGRNTLTRNVSCENHKYGFRFEIARARGKDPVFSVRQPDGSFADRDVRTIPFLRFEDNESHSEGLYSFFLGDDPAGSVTSDAEHPFIARKLRAWQTHYCLRANTTHFLMEDFEVWDGVYGVYHPDYNAHVYRDIKLHRVVSEPINRGHDDESVQYGNFTYDGLLLDNCGRGPLIQLTCTSPVKGLSGHFRNVRVEHGRNRPEQVRVVDLGVGPVLPDAKLQEGVAYYFHDSAGGTIGGSSGGGKALRVVSTRLKGMTDDGDYKPVPGLTGRQVKAAEVPAPPFPKLLSPVDDLPPATIITSRQVRDGKTIIRGVSTDNGQITGVRVNGQSAKITSQQSGVADWEIELSADGRVSAVATDDAGNVEKMPAMR